MACTTAAEMLAAAKLLRNELACHQILRLGFLLPERAAHSRSGGGGSSHSSHSSHGSSRAGHTGTGHAGNGHGGRVHSRSRERGETQQQALIGMSSGAKDAASKRTAFYASTERTNE